MTERCKICGIFIGENHTCPKGTFEERFGIEKAREIKRKIGLGNKGRIWTEEAKLKISQKNKNNPNLSLCKLGDKNPMKNLEARQKMIKTKKRLFAEGKIQSWNEGLTKETDERMRKSAINGGKTRKRLFAEGKLINPMQDKPHSKATKLKISILHKGKHFSPETEFKKGISHPKSIEARKKLSITRKQLYKEGKLKNWNTGQKCPQLSGENHPRYGKHLLEEERQNLRIKAIDRWQNEEYKERTIKASMKAQHIKPNKPEIFLNNLLQENNLLFNYVGDGQLIIGGRCPDFVCNPSKKVILLHGDWWHYYKLKRKNPLITRESVEVEDKAHYKNLFFDALIIWEHELKNSAQVIEKIRKFIK